MKKIKLLLIALMVILTGCTATDTVTLSKNGKVTESVTILEDNAKVIYGDKNLEDSVRQYLNEYINVFSIKKYSYDVLVQDEQSGANIHKEYNNLCDFINNSIFTQYLYKHINCLDNDDSYIVESTGDFITIDSYIEDEIIPPEKMKLVLKLPFSLDDENADYSGKNSYTWVFDTSTKSSKKVYFKVDKNKIKKAIKEYKLEKKEEKRKKNIMKITIISIIVISVLIGGFFAYIIFQKKYNENKIDY